MSKSNFFKILGLFFFSFMVVLSSCKKNKPSDNNDNGTTTPQGGNGGATVKADDDSLKYLMYHIMETSFVDGGRDKQNDLPLYFWYKQVPTLDPFSTTYPKVTDFLTKIISYPELNGKKIDRYTFLDDGSVVGEIQGNAGDKGLDIGFIPSQQGDNLAYPILKAVDKNSPAGQAGVQRGWVIMKVNNADAGVKLAGGRYLDQSDPNFKTVLNAVYNDAQATFQFKTLDATNVSLTIASAKYQLNPILFDTVYNNIGGQKVGYFVFNTFSDIYNSYDQQGNGSGPTLTKQELDRVFNKFSGAGISNLIIDLRYNGGGAVTTAEYISDNVAPSSANGKVMYTQNYNDRINTLFKAAELTTNFANTGTLGNLQHVFFIVSKSTASASELVINNLKPYMDVKLIGDTTYGKPVGSLVREITDFKDGKEQFLAYLLPIAFDFKNSAGQGQYYSGMIPDVKATDFADINWGDVRDDNLIQAFNYITSGHFNGRMIPTQDSWKKPGAMLKIQENGNKQMPTLRYNGMLDTRGIKKSSLIR